MMRTILALISGGAASRAAIDSACRLGLCFGSHIEALHIRRGHGDLAYGLGVDREASAWSDFIEFFTRSSEEAAMSAYAAFTATLAVHRLVEGARPPADGRSSAHWREQMGFARSALSRHMRLFDLVVIGRSDRPGDKDPGDKDVERERAHWLLDIVVHSARAALVCPVGSTLRDGGTIAVAWDGSAEAMRAVAAALPLMQRAAEVRLITVGEDGIVADAELADHLAWYGIKAVACGVAAGKGARIGERLLAAARDHRADLMVMGAFGHPPWHELFFGGVTRTLVEGSRLPLLLAH